MKLTVIKNHRRKGRTFYKGDTLEVTRDLGNRLIKEKKAVLFGTEIKETKQTKETK